MKTIARLRSVGLGLVLAVLALPTTAIAFTIDDFETVSDPASALFFSGEVVGTGNSTPADLGLLDFGLAVTVDGSKMILEFLNNSSISSVITLIYFDDSGESLIGNGSVVSPQVNNVLKFNIGGGAPGDLPGGNTIDFTANTALTAHASNPKPKNGIGGGERLILSYDHFGSPAAVGAALLDGTLRIGMHVQSIGSGGTSDAFIFDEFVPPPPVQTPVPEPATMVLLGLGTGMIVLRKRFTV